MASRNFIDLCDAAVNSERVVAMILGSRSILRRNWNVKSVWVASPVPDPASKLCTCENVGQLKG